MALALYTAIPTMASGVTKGDDGVTSCIGFTFTSSTTGPGLREPGPSGLFEVANLFNLSCSNARSPRDNRKVGVLQSERW
jgi:hypothetical protein